MIKNYNPNIDYCGPGHGFLTKIIPRKLFGEDINLVCYYHDRAYAEGGVRYKVADLLLKDHIQDVYNAAGKRLEGYLVSNVYYLAVRIGRGCLWLKGLFS